jgi:membrane-bound metal-dependent hydrolase YbcI (DUF457 family)
MMVGHAALAFAIAAWAAVALGVARERALLVGVAAGAFAVVPDVDIGYAIVGIATTPTAGLSGFPEVFWEIGNTVHRGLTHSLVVGAVAAALFGLAAYRGRLRAAAIAGLAALAAVMLVLLDPLEAGVTLSFALAGLAVAVGARRAGLEPRVILGAALVGVVSHPFGDVFTGTAPTLLFPFDVDLLPRRVLLSGDPTLHLLGAFGLELAAVWLAVGTAVWLHGHSLREYVTPRATLGVGYAGVVPVLAPPTLAVSYHFVFSVLAVGAAVTALALVRDPHSPRVRQRAFVTGLAATTAAWLAYAVGYLLVGPV